MGDTKNDKLKEITERLEQGILTIFSSESYQAYLRVMSRFHNYSTNNLVLILLQKPEATLVAGFHTWKSKFGRTVKKGEKGIAIFAPITRKVKTEKEKLDPQTKLPIIGENGLPEMVEQEITIPRYRVVYVFDISQTTGRDLPTPVIHTLTGDVERYADFFAALERTSPVPIGFEEIPGDAHGYYSFVEKRIAIDTGMSEMQNLKTLIHEIAHAKLHDIDPDAPRKEQAKIDKRTREVQAESVAYTVCQHFGLDTSDYSFVYIASWSSGWTLPELKSSLEVIRQTAAEMIDSIEVYFAELGEKQAASESVQAA